jgi:hypothetical protein
MTEAKGTGIDGASVLLGAALGLGIGAVLGWLFSKRQMEKELVNEVLGLKSYYADKARAEAAADDSDNSAERAEATMGAGGDGVHVIQVGRPVSYGPVMYPPGHPLEGLEGDSTADDGGEDDDDDSPPEPVVRDPTKPYVIGLEEFTEENENYNKITLTYYALDDTLADERDAPIRDTSIIGVTFPELFGEDPDPDIIYIRNDKLTVDFEVVKKEQSFTETVLGYGKPQ